MRSPVRTAPAAAGSTYRGIGQELIQYRLARDCRHVLPPADEIKFMIMTAGGVSDPYCHPLTTPMS
jgi:hypothetical protein